MAVIIDLAHQRLQENGLRHPLSANCGRIIRFDLDSRSGSLTGSIIAKVKDAYTITRGELDKPDKVVLKLVMKSVRGEPLHSLTFDLETGLWSLNIRAGYEHPHFAYGTVIFIDEDAPEPAIADERVQAFIHNARLPAAVSHLLGSTVHFFTPEKTTGGHHLVAQIECLEVNAAIIRLHCLAHPFLGRTIELFTWERGIGWKAHMVKAGVIEYVQGDLELPTFLQKPQLEVVGVSEERSA